ncbi:hypothetical protein PR202_gb01238 [Eleusine coracana subsp. coracana]|uniref:Uncharacterized protein n=1 Tax=Eleusine coracana subsp. coracana TaxID=191504 RepID=A0AAV5DW38_ELECO|nr:hypothetical protein PR202_gb01238 [Eleusine coracana subsp. coracana]
MAPSRPPLWQSPPWPSRGRQGDLKGGEACLFPCRSCLPLSVVSFRCIASMTDLVVNDALEVADAKICLEKPASHSESWPYAREVEPQIAAVASSCTDPWGGGCSRARRRRCDAGASRPYDWGKPLRPARRCRGLLARRVRSAAPRMFRKREGIWPKSNRDDGSH